MLLTPHTLVGVTIGSTVHDPYLAVPLSFGMHFMGDLVPHWDFYTRASEHQMINGWRPLAVMADLAAGVGVGMFFTLYALWVLGQPQIALNIFLCGIASVLPDALTAHTLYTKVRLPIITLVSAAQTRLQVAAGPVFGLLSQVLVCCFSLLLIVRSLGL